MAAVGCPDLSPPAGGWVRRDRDIATVACNISGERWHLACDGHVWIGEYRNCTGEFTNTFRILPANFTLALFSILIFIHIDLKWQDFIVV